MDISSAFKVFDIRGVYPEVVDERLAFAVGKAAALLKKPQKVLVASDTRESSPTLKRFLIDGLFCGGVAEVVDLYEVPSPEFYFVLAQDSYQMGVIVTASHISNAENGFKLAGARGLPFDQTEMVKLKEAIEEMKNEPVVVPHKQASRANATDQYVEALLGRVSFGRITTKLLLDITKSSVLTPVLVIFSRLRADYSLVKSDHTGNPLLPENRRILEETMTKIRADLGMMWDSDGDRAVFVDRRGRLIPMSFVLGILASQAVREYPAKKVLVDYRAGLVVRDLVLRVGGQLEVLPSWAQNIKFEMARDANVVFGGETSGHFIYRDFFGIDDGILAALRFLELFEKGKIEPLLKDLAKCYFELPERNYHCDAKTATTVLQNLTEYYRSSDYDVSVADGLTVFGLDFKFNLRQSLTEPFLRLNVEAGSEKQAREVVEKLEKNLNV